MFLLKSSFEPLWFQNILTAVVGSAIYFGGAGLIISNYKEVNPANTTWNDYIDVAQLQTNAKTTGGLMALNALLVLGTGVGTAVSLKVEMARKRRSQNKNGHAVSK